MGLLHFSGLGPGGRGYAGASIEHRNYATGCLSFIPETDELTFAGFAYNSVTRGPWSFGLSLRVDNRVVTPAAADSNKAGLIRRRQFAGLSGGVDIDRRISESLGAAFTVMRSFHPPGIEELFSDGPHLAAYSYEVGNADLGEEAGTGLELALRKEGEGPTFQLSAFRNAISSFIYPTNTGEIEYGPGEDGFLARYQYVGRDAVLYGGELSVEWPVITAFSVGGTLSYVRGELRDQEGGSLPSIPPIAGNAHGLYESGPWSAQARLRAAGPQDRVGEFEEPTAGYVVFDAFVDYQLLARGTVQSLMLSVENLADTEYRNHLSRIRSIMPEPGRNLRLFYRMTFGPSGR
jgi:iron complex outermembrane receptor protein